MNQVQNTKINEYLTNIHPAVVPQKVEPSGNIPNVGINEFSNLLESKLKVSNHAQTRLESRNIQLDKSDWDRVLRGIEKAAEKGSKESLMLVDDKEVALVVSVKNRTVITAMDKENLRENVFTNIDSAVIV